MKISEIHLDEVPVGGFKQAARSIGSKVMNKLPGTSAKSKAANLAGKADLGKTANDLFKDFNSYLGTQDKNLNQATGEDLVAFLKTKNHKTAVKIPSGVLQKSQVDQIMMAVAKEAMAGQGGTASGSAPVDATKGSKTGKPKIPAPLLQKLQSLTPAEKKQLAALL